VLRKDESLTGYEYREQISYKPFGEVKDRLYCTGSTDADARLKYIGKQMDFETNLADHGVRKYDNTLGQFTSIDPLWEKYYGWTPYHYCINDPLGRKDDNGKWAPAIHEVIVRNACLGLGLTKNQVDAIVYGNVAVDDDQEDQSKHAMRSEGQSESEARKKANDFVNDNLQAFDNTGKLYYLGQATHTTQDQYCPSHKGFQVWYDGGIVNPLNWLHFLGDLYHEKEVQKAIEATRKMIIKALEELDKPEQRKRDAKIQ
jgi:RHS repeat-associated protein